MSTTIAKTNGTELTNEMIVTLEQARIVPKNTPEAQIKIFAQVCAEKGLSPFSKEIYLIEYAGNFSTIIAIDGFRKLADKTGALAGCSDAQFDLQSNGQFHTAATLQAANRTPITCTVTVHKMVGSVPYPFTHTAVFKEFSSGRQKWASMPFQMINKVAEAFALRKAFAANLSGFHIEEEKAAIEGITEASAITVEAQAPQAQIAGVSEDVINLINMTDNIEDLRSIHQKNNWAKIPAVHGLALKRKEELTALKNVQK